MSTFDDASLVFIPSGYKTSKAYSVKPSDGSGDLTFSRSNDTATRVNSAGLIEKVRTNLVLQSQTFDNASWTKDGVTVTANSTTAPDGTTTADKVLETATTATHNIYQVPTLSSNIYSISFFVKKAERFKVAIADRNSGGYVAFNLNTGAIIESLLFSGKIQSLANDWYRVTITSASAVSIINPQVFILPDSYTTGVPALITYAGSATSGLFVWGAQLETGDIATDYIATTSAAVSVGPVANVPRLDYLNSSCPRLLLEPQRTNIYLNSEQFNNASWTKSNTTVSANTAISPDGYTNADTLSDIIGTNLDYVLNVTSPISYTSGTAYTVSFYAKNVDRRYMYLRFVTNAFGSNKYAYFDLQNGVISKLDAGTTATITSVGNGWYRCTATATATTTVSTIFAIYLGLSADGQNNFYTNASPKSIYIYGAQLEAGAYATSYIPTLGAAVTRGADACSKTGISSLIGQTEGTIFWEFDVKIPSAPALESIVNIDNGSFGNTFYIYQSAGSITGEMYASGSSQCLFNKPSITAGVYKCALAYANNNTAFFVNGVQVGSTDTSCSVPATSRIQMGQTALSSDTSWTKQLLLFKTRLTNAQLAELTTI